MKTVIIEDENAAAKRLQKLLREVMPDVEVLEVLDSIEASVNYFNKNPQPHLLLMDIHLADGLCFDIFKEVEISCPVIFTTAYDQYAIEAFKVNSIDYLLKPVKKEELERSLQKLKNLRKENAPPADYSELIKALQGEKKDYHKRFLIKIGQNIKAVDVSEAAYFYTENKITFMNTKEGKSYPVEYSLEKLDEMLDPERFFRINRQFIVAIDAIGEMYAYSKSRVKLVLKPAFKESPIVSTERSPGFKGWLGGE